MTAGVLLVLVLTAGAVFRATAVAVGYDNDDDGGDNIGSFTWRNGYARLVFIAGPNASCPLLASLVDESQPERTSLEICTRALPVAFEGVSSEYETQAPTSIVNSTLEETSVNGTKVPHGYTYLSGGGVYKVHQEKMTWHEAKATCEAEGAHLVIVDSKEEAAAIRGHLESQRAWWRKRPFTLHAGFSMGFKTSDGRSLSSLAYERWAPMQPAAPICGRIDHDAWLLFGPCSQAERFMCEYEQNVRSPSSGTTNTVPRNIQVSFSVSQMLKLIDQRYEQFADGWYKRFDMSLDFFRGNLWDDALDACRRDGAELAVVETEKEADAVVNFFQHISGSEPRGDTLLALRTSEPFDILGNPVSASSYHLWVEKILPDSCLCIDIKVMFRTCSCENVSLSFLCKYSPYKFTN